MSETVKPKPSSIRKVRLLWTPGNKAAEITGIAAGPLIALATLQTKFSLIPFACWYGWMPALHTIAIVGLLLVAASGLLCWRNWRAAGSEAPGEADSPEDRARFLALVGLGSCALAFLAIVGQEIANLSLNPCQ